MSRSVLSLGIPALIQEKLLRNGYRTAADLESDNDSALLKFLTPTEAHRLSAAVMATKAASVDYSSAWSRIQQRQTRHYFLTQLDALDTLLGGRGLGLGNIAEVIGDPGSGQTQLCLRLCIAAQLPAELGGIEMRAVYVDCIGSFSSSGASRAVQSISRYCQQSSHEQLLNGVGVFRVYSAHELMALLVSFENIRSQLNNVVLVSQAKASSSFAGSSTGTGRWPTSMDGDVWSRISTHRIALSRKNAGTDQLTQAQELSSQEECYSVALCGSFSTPSSLQLKANISLSPPIITIAAMSTITTERPSDITKWQSKNGEYHRQVSSFRSFVEADPNAEFPAEAGRYHLYVSYACPWAHRTLIVRKLKGLENLIGVSVVHYLMGQNGWEFASPEEVPGATLDTVNGAKYIREVYFKAEPGYSARFTVPVLWDKKKNTIVSNESSEIIRMFNSAFDEFVAPEYQGISFYPEVLREKIDEINEWIYDTVNNGVYKSGFATAQAAYEKNCIALFKSLDRIENILGNNEFLLGSRLTEADIRLFTTMVRFDPVYHGHFKCNLKQIATGYPNILRWTREIYQLPGVEDTVNMEHIKKHYYMSHTQINPSQVVPLSNGPDLESPAVKPSSRPY
ncbi:S-glutathionyl-(chloro)hydroquinone reductase [Coemansia spiralis]|uniref:S-glutathionyl-(Chloro)hydroquinone reductase n=1 Tax=Coemansia spiralis TaxID=417178 RepID=A0A9W8G7U5_9FUNG|nr:S-glutathionyl-(chloro)hydroquinone reductase [Coemansia spiralis]